MRYLVWHAEEMKQLASSNNPVTSRNKVVLRYNTLFSSIHHIICTIAYHVMFLRIVFIADYEGDTNY